MYINIYSIKSQYRGADRDLDLDLFKFTSDWESNFKLYCDFCNYELEFNGEDEILNNRLELLKKLSMNNDNVELLIFDKNPIEHLPNLNFLGLDILNDFFESPLSHAKGKFFKENQMLLNDHMLFKNYQDAQNAINKNPCDEAGHYLDIYYIYKYLI